MILNDYIREVPDFPKPGVSFKDISPLLKNAEALEFVCKEFGRRMNLEQADYFVGIESRGFILASLLSAYYKKGFVLLRKAGKLPPPVVTQAYSLEYGEAVLEINPGQGRVIIFDDVLATGGTLQAGINLCAKAGYSVVDVGVLINLRFLNAMRFNGQEIVSLLQY